MKKGKILITGSEGFIGKHLVNTLKNDWEIIGWDIKQYNDIFDLNNIYGLKTVIHLAALTNVRASFMISDRYYRTNVLGTAHILNLCQVTKTPLIYLSSAAIDDRKSSPYAFSKFRATELVNDLGAVILKPYNIYGENPPVDSLFYNYSKKDELAVYGDGKQTRDFIHVSIVCDIIKTALEESWKPCILDVGTGTKTRVLDVANLFHKKIGKKIIHQDLETTEIKHSVADTTKLKKLYKKPLTYNMEDFFNE